AGVSECVLFEDLTGNELRHNHQADVEHIVHNPYKVIIGSVILKVSRLLNHVIEVVTDAEKYTSIFSKERAILALKEELMLFRISVNDAVIEDSIQIISHLRVGPPDVPSIILKEELMLVSQGEHQQQQPTHHFDFLNPIGDESPKTNVDPIGDECVLIDCYSPPIKEEVLAFRLEGGHMWIFLWLLTGPSTTGVINDYSVLSCREIRANVERIRIKIFSCGDDMLHSADLLLDFLVDPKSEIYSPVLTNHLKKMDNLMTNVGQLKCVKYHGYEPSSLLEASKSVFPVRDNLALQAKSECFQLQGLPISLEHERIIDYSLLVDISVRESNQDLSADEGDLSWDRVRLGIVKLGLMVIKYFQNANLKFR
ncbi:hypothetical protein Tco_0903185, partial [Tanacetum coccineum]